MLPYENRKKQNTKQIREGTADCSNECMRETFKWNEKTSAVYCHTCAS